MIIADSQILLQVSNKFSESLQSKPLNYYQLDYSLPPIQLSQNSFSNTDQYTLINDTPIQRSQKQLREVVHSLAFRP